MNPDIIILASARGDDAWLTTSLGLMLFAVAVVAVMVIITVSWINRWWQVAALICSLWLAVGVLIEPWSVFQDKSVVGESGSYWKAAAVVWGIIFLLCLLALISSALSHKSHGHHHRRRRRKSRRTREYAEKDPRSII